MMPRYGKISFILLLLAAILFSYQIPRRDLRATAQVAGIALDQGEDGLVATFEIYSADMDETIGAKREIEVSKGKSLEECIGNILYTKGKELFVNDASVLILGGSNSEALLEEALEYYRLLAHNHMDLAVFFAKGKASDIFSGEGGVVSMELEESARRLKCTQTIKDLMNEEGERVYLKGEGEYEIQK